MDQKTQVKLSSTSKACAITHSGKWWENTKSTFKSIGKNEAKELLKAFLSAKRKRSFNGTFEFNGKTYTTLHASVKKNSYHKSRGASFYFRKKGTRSVIRISDHWSSVISPSLISRKFNCFSIASCKWHVDNDTNAFYHRLPGERYESRLIAAKASKFELIVNTYPNYHAS